MPEIDDFCAWARTRSVGCYFARAMFKAPADYGITLKHVTHPSGSEIATALDKATNAAIADASSEAIAFVFNRNLPIEEYAAVLRRLADMPNWFLREEFMTYQTRDYAVVGLDVAVGTDHDVQALSEVVGFAPYDYLPVTRRAPVPALVLRTKAAFSLEPLSGRSERRANLAAIRLQIDTNAFNTLWEKSQALRAELDGRNNPMARARVALALPAGVWQGNMSASVRTGNV